MSLYSLAKVLRMPSRLGLCTNDELLTNATMPFSSTLSDAQRKNRTYGS
jgi:hypothetical protein